MINITFHPPANNRVLHPYLSKKSAFILQSLHYIVHSISLNIFLIYHSNLPSFFLHSILHPIFNSIYSPFYPAFPPPSYTTISVLQFSLLPSFHPWLKMFFLFQIKYTQHSYFTSNYLLLFVILLSLSILLDFACGVRNGWKRLIILSILLFYYCFKIKESLFSGYSKMRLPNLVEHDTLHEVSNQGRD